MRQVKSQNHIKHLNKPTLRPKRQGKIFLSGKTGKTSTLNLLQPIMIINFNIFNIMI